MSEYTEQAERVANQIGITVGIKRAATQTSPKWAKGKDHGVKYRITLARKGPRGAKMSFDFWGSIHDKRNGEDPSIYDVLATVGSDANMPTTAEEVISEFGDDMPRAQATAVARFAHKLQDFFTEDERMLLSEVQ